MYHLHFKSYRDFYISSENDYPDTQNQVSLGTSLETIFIKYFLEPKNTLTITLSADEQNHVSSIVMKRRKVKIICNKFVNWPLVLNCTNWFWQSCNNTILILEFQYSRLAYTFYSIIIAKAGQCVLIKIITLSSINGFIKCFRIWQPHKFNKERRFIDSCFTPLIYRQNHSTR